MTPEEAIAVFDKMLKRYDWAEDNKSVQAIKVAKECIKKQIPQKPYHPWDDYGDGFMCSSCNTEVYKYSRYCDKCGQKLKRGEEE